MEKIVSSIRDEIRELDCYKAGKASSKPGGRVIKLASNENRFGTSPRAVEAIRQAMEKGFAVYPDSRMVKLREAVCGFWKRRGIILDPDSLLFGDGSGEVLNMLLSAFVREKDIVVFPENSFILYALLSVPKGAQVIEVERRDFHIDLQVMANAVNALNAKVAIIANPDNPVSTFLSAGEIEKFLASIPATAMVLLDEAYIHFAGLENSAIRLTEKYPNLILSYTFSKAYGLAGLRVGYGVMHPEVAREVEKIRLPFNLGVLQQAGAAAALEDEDFLSLTVDKTREGREFLTDKFKEMGILRAEAYGNFLFVDLGEDFASVFAALEEQGITIRNLSDFGYSSNYARITVGTMEENELLVEILNSVLAKTI